MGRSYTSRNSNSKAVHIHHEVTLPHHEDSILIITNFLSPFWLVSRSQKLVSYLLSHRFRDFPPTIYAIAGCYDLTTLYICLTPELL